MKIDFSMRFDHPVEQVWPYLAEPERWLDYTPALVERTRLDDGPVRLGSMWRSADRVGPLTVWFTDELVTLEPGRRVAFRQSAPWNSIGEFKFEPDGDGSILHLHFEARPSGKIRWLAFVPDWLASRIYQNDMKVLARVLREGPAPTKVGHAEGH